MEKVGGASNGATNLPGEERSPSSTPSPLPVELGEDEDMANWYKETFQTELSEARQLRRVSSGSAFAKIETVSSENAPGGQDLFSDLESSASSNHATKLEIALLQAQEQMESHEKQKELLESRLQSLAELDELRMKLATLELESLLSERGRVTPPIWDRDEDHIVCQRCLLPFSLTRRRHHCRHCGKCLCGECAPSTNVAPIPKFGYHQPVRHCLDCLPKVPSPRSPVEQGAAHLSVDQKPFSSAIDGVRFVENNALKNPTSENILLALNAYVNAIEKIAKSENIQDAYFRKSAHSALSSSMHAFLRMPDVQKKLVEGNLKSSHDELLRRASMEEDDDNEV